MVKMILDVPKKLLIGIYCQCEGISYSPFVESELLKIVHAEITENHMDTVSSSMKED